MFSIKKILKKLIGNKVTEKEIRDWVGKHRADIQSIKFFELELHAIQRPGWLQVYRFHIHVKKTEEEQWSHLFGVVRSDERYNRFEIEFFENSNLRDYLMNQWSESMIKRRRR